MNEGTPRADACIVVNGEAQTLPPGATLTDVLAALRVGSDTATAVAVNDRVVRRGEWSTYRLASGDRVEVLRPLAGG